MDSIKLVDPGFPRYLSPDIMASQPDLVFQSDGGGLVFEHSRLIVASVSGLLSQLLLGLPLEDSAVVSTQIPQHHLKRVIEFLNWGILPEKNLDRSLILSFAALGIDICNLTFSKAEMVRSEEGVLLKVVRPFRIEKAIPKDYAPDIKTEWDPEDFFDFDVDVNDDKDLGGETMASPKRQRAPRGSTSSKGHCPHCGYVYPNTHGLKSHKEKWGIYHTDKCVQCAHDVKTWQEHQVHIKESHADVWLYICGRCEEVFNNQEERHRHRVEEHPGEKTTCDICGLAVQKITDHRARVHGAGVEEKLACHICPKTFNLEKDLRLHVSRHEKNFSCEVCGKQFSSKGTVEAHMVRIHLPKDQRPYKCNYCSRAYNEKVKLNDHVNSHTGARPNKCRYCSDTFAQHFEKLTHEQVVHEGKGKGLKNANSKNYVPRSQSEKKHPLPLPTATCDQCGKKLANKYRLRAHIIGIHMKDEEKPHKCDHCQKGFAEKTKLQAHLRSHSNERVYSCQYCGKGFNVKGNMVDHEKTVHLGEKRLKRNKKMPTLSCDSANEKNE